MRKAAISAAAIFSALVLALYLWRISPFLPIAAARLALPPTTALPAPST